MQLHPHPLACLMGMNNLQLTVIEPGCLGCRYVLNYTVTDSLGLSAVPLQLEVIVYESASVQASLLMISQIDYTGAIARAQAHTNTERLTDASASTANTAMRQVTSLLLLVALKPNLFFFNQNIFLFSFKKSSYMI